MADAWLNPPPFRSRGATVYLPEVRAPMFPLQLAVDLFSLEPGHLPHGLPAVTFSAKVDTHTGAMLDMRVRPSRIGTITKLTYEAADALIAPAVSGEAPAGSAEAAARLQDLSDLTAALRARRRAAGAVSFTLPKVRPSNIPACVCLRVGLTRWVLRPMQPKLVVEAAAGTVAVSLEKASSPAHLMVEELMILAGHIAATVASDVR